MTAGHYEAVNDGEKLRERIKKDCVCGKFPDDPCCYRCQPIFDRVRAELERAAQIADSMIGATRHEIAAAIRKLKE